MQESPTLRTNHPPPSCRSLSGDQHQDYFTEDVVKEIITALSRPRWLFVIAGKTH